MTYCIGWKSSSAVFLIADTVRTVEHNSSYKSAKDITSFGESSINESFVVVEEYINKIFQIERKVILCFSGDVDLAVEIFDIYKKHIDLKDILGSFELSVNAVRQQRILDVIFLIGFYEKNIPCLYSFNKKNDLKFIEEKNPVQIGSMSNSPYSALSKRFFEEHLAKISDNELQFYQTLSFFQHLGIHDHTLKFNAGGMYVGIYLTDKGAKWMEDSTYILYDKKISTPLEIHPIGRVQILFRYDTLIHSSTISGKKEMFIYSTNNPIYLNEQVQDDLIKLEKQSLSRFFCFLCINDRTIVMIKTNGINCNDFFCEDINDVGKIRMGVRPKLLQILKGSLFTKNNFLNLFWDEAKLALDEEAMRIELRR